MRYDFSQVRKIVETGLARLSGLVALIGGLYIFMGLAVLAVVPVEAARNKDRLDDVKHAIEYKLQHGELPKEFQYDPDKSGINSMWVDGLDECHPDFQPPESDKFVIGFWQADWWNCYAYPSGTTTIVTDSAELLRGTPGKLSIEYLLKGLLAVGLAIALRLLSREGRGLSLVAMSVWFSAINYFLGLSLMLRHEVSRQFVSVEEWWTGLAYDITLGAVTLSILRPIGYLAEISPAIGSMLAVTVYVFLPFIFWALLFFFGAKLIASSIKRMRNRKDIIEG